MQEEIRRSTRDGSSSKNDDKENLALKSKSRKGKGKDSYFKSNSSHGGKKGDMSKVRCFNCHKMGHYVTNCPSKKSKKGSSEGSEGVALTSQFEMDFTLITCIVSSMMGCVWYLNSGVSFHMTGDKNLFSALEEKDLKMHIEMGDDRRKVRIVGRGKVKLKLQGGRARTLPGVLHIPALAKNLISTTKLDDAGVKTVFKKDICETVCRALVLMQGVRVGTLYKLQGSTVVDGCNSSVVLESGAENLMVSREKTMLWHERLGHIGEKDLQILHGKGMVEGMSNSSLDFDLCENCVYGK
eukprot:PITA_34905